MELKFLNLKILFERIFEQNLFSLILRSPGGFDSTYYSKSIHCNFNIFKWILVWGKICFNCRYSCMINIKEFPQALETLTPDIECLTPYQRDIGVNAGIIHDGVCHGTNKLVPHLYHHTNYAMH